MFRQLKLEESLVATRNKEKDVKRFLGKSYIISLVYMASKILILMILAFVGGLCLLQLSSEPGYK